MHATPTVARRFDPVTCRFCTATRRQTELNSILHTHTCIGFTRELGLIQHLQQGYMPLRSVLKCSLREASYPPTHRRSDLGSDESGPKPSVGQMLLLLLGCAFAFDSVAGIFTSLPAEVSPGLLAYCEVETRCAFSLPVCLSLKATFEPVGRATAALLGCRKALGSF